MLAYKESIQILKADEAPSKMVTQHSGEGKWPQTPDDFQEFINAYQHKLVGYACRRLGSIPDAEDVFQNVMLKVFAQRHSRHDVVHVESYLYRMIANECKDFEKKRKRERLTASQAQVEQRRNAEELPSDLDSQIQALHQIDRILDRLPERQAEVVRLRFYTGLRFTEIAQVMGCSIATVQSRLTYALEKLSKEMKERVQQ